MPTVRLSASRLSEKPNEMCQIQAHLVPAWLFADSSLSLSKPPKALPPQGYWVWQTHIALYSCQLPHHLSKFLTIWNLQCAPPGFAWGLCSSTNENTMKRNKSWLNYQQQVCTRQRILSWPAADWILWLLSWPGSTSHHVGRSWGPLYDMSHCHIVRQCSPGKCQSLFPASASRQNNAAIVCPGCWWHLPNSRHQCCISALVHCDMVQLVHLCCLEGVWLDEHWDPDFAQPLNGADHFTWRHSSAVAFSHCLGGIHMLLRITRPWEMRNC